MRRALAVVVASLAALASAGCTTGAPKRYEGGDVARTSPALRETLDEGECLERGFAVYDGRTSHPRSLLLVTSFGNRCARPVRLDLSRTTVHVFGPSPERDSAATTLYRKDPYAEIGPRTLDAYAWASETVRYQLTTDIAPIRRVCVCVDGCASPNDALEGGRGVTCFDPAREKVRPAAEIAPGWLEPRWRGESPKTRRCRDTGRGERHYVVGESPCTTFGEFWSVEDQPPIAASIFAGAQRVPTSASIMNDRGSRTTGEILTFGELGVIVAWTPSPFFYLGGSFGVGFGAGPAGTVEPVRGDRQTSVTAGTLVLQPVVGARLPLGSLSLRAELAAPLRAVAVIGPTDPSTQKRETIEYGLFGVVPRLALDVWTDHRSTLGIVIGADVVHVGGATLGVVFGGHGRAYDGRY